MHPLPKIDGCSRNHRTYSNDEPVILSRILLNHVTAYTYFSCETKMVYVGNRDEEVMNVLKRKSHENC